MSEELNNKDGTLDEENTLPKENGDEPDFSEMESEGMESDIEQLQNDLAESQDQLLRLAAEFENFKKRITRERETLVKYAGENVLRELLTTVDNLDRALEQGLADSDDAGNKLDAMLEGVELTRKGLLATLEKFEVKPVESVGQEFDPSEHEAMTMEASDTVPANHVLTEFVRGYRFKDRLLRAAKVVVSSGK